MDERRREREGETFFDGETNLQHAFITMEFSQELRWLDREEEIRVVIYTRNIYIERVIGRQDEVDLVLAVF